MKLCQLLHSVEVVQWTGNNLEEVTQFLKTAHSVMSKIQVNEPVGMLNIRIGSERFVLYQTEWLVRMYVPFETYATYTNRGFHNTFKPAPRLELVNAE